MFAVKNVTVKGNRVEANLVIPEKYRHYYLSDFFFAEYDEPLTCSQGIAAIAPLSSVIPMAITQGEPVSVDELDRTYYDSIHAYCAAMKKTYTFIKPLKLEVGTLTDNNIGASGDAITFTGGVDSLYTLAHFFNCKPRIITLNRYTYREWRNDFYLRMKVHYSSFAVANGLRCNYPTTNARDILNYKKLIERLNPVVKTDWFSIVAQTLVLYSAMAPLSIGRFDKLYFPATDCFETWFPYDAQTPALDDLLRWADLTTVHHGYIHRHLKYPLVTRFCREHGLRIQSCFLPSMYDCKSDFAFGYNCSHCEKCSYTIAGLSMLGIDPHGCGFTLNSGTWAKMRHNLETKQWKAPLNAHVHCFWLPLQRALPSNIPNIRGSEDFFKWFRTAEL